jgi:dTDP-4-dehydrorhamnose reductase
VNAVVLGAGGLLGHHVVEELRHKGNHVQALDRRRCDISILDEVVRQTAGAQLFVNCAAYTNVDGAEANEEDAYRANALGAENVARAAERHGARLVHISTDFVFDGVQTHPYDEFDAPRPLAVYARSKWAGEQLVARAASRLFLVRVQGLYGAGGGNFSSKLRELVRARKPLKLDAERRVQPTWARAAARQIVRLASTDSHGTYHVSCHGETTWAGFARALAQRLGVEPSWSEVPTAALAAPAPRPPNCLFRHRMLALRGIDVMPDWRLALDEYLAECAAREAQRDEANEKGGKR